VVAGQSAMREEAAAGASSVDHSTGIRQHGVAWQAWWLKHDGVHGNLVPLENPDAQHRGETLAVSSTSHAPRDMSPSINRLPIMFEVPPARIPEEPGAVIPHTGICKGGVGQPASLS